MTRQRLTPVAVLLAAVLAMGTAKAQSVKIAVSSEYTYTFNIASSHIIVTGVVAPPRTFTSQCMNGQRFDVDEEGAKVVAVDGRFTQVIPQVHFSEPLPPGTRLVNFTQAAICVEGGETIRVFDCEVANPRRLDLALVTTPAGITLAADHEAVVGAGTDELGIADAVCVKKGEKSVKTGIISDILLEAGDRLTDFLELDFNPDTGETTYACWLEY